MESIKEHKCEYRYNKTPLLYKIFCTESRFFGGFSLYEERNRVLWYFFKVIARALITNIIYT